MAELEKDEHTGTETTGHVWDGIKELDTPTPRWWLWTLYATIIWSVGYMVLYPAWPLIERNTQGILGYSSRADVARELADHKIFQSKFVKKMASKSLEAIRKDSALYDFAVRGGRSAYLVNCSQCHGTGAAGFKGFPNLNDDDWLWGGSLTEIYTTIAHGIRFEKDEETRLSDMPAFLNDQLLTTAQISDTAEYVLSLAKVDHDRDAAKRGKPLFVENCVACHGDLGQGNRQLGAPKLNDAISLFGTVREEITHQISAPRHGVMPAWTHRLDDVTIKQLTLYIHSLGGGE